MLNRLTVLLKSRLLTVLLSCLVIVTSLSYGIKVELRKHVESELQALSAEHRSVALEQFNAPTVSPETNAAPLYMAAIELNSSGSIEVGATMEETLQKDGDRVQRILAARAPTWTLLDMAYHLPNCSFSFDMRKGYSMRIPNFVAARSMAQLVSARAMTDLRAGHAQNAVGVLTNFCCFSRRFHFGESLIHTMIRVAIDAIALEPLERMAHDRVRADYSALLREVDLLLADNRLALDRSIDAERALGYQFLSDPEAAANEVSHYARSDDWHDTAMRLLYQVAGPTMVLADQAVLLETFRQYQSGVHDLDDATFPATPGCASTDPAFKNQMSIQMREFTEALKARHNGLHLEPPDNRSLLLASCLLPNMVRAVFQVRFLDARLLKVRQQLADLNTR